ncbi:Eukaryotic translation initiation factor 4E-like 1, partial [Homarus americanus]
NAEKQQYSEVEVEGELEVSPDVLIKHPLENTWTLWFFKIDPTKTWEDCQMLVASFNTIEDFWAVYNHIDPPSLLKNGRDYSLFKQHIKPMWEDENNCNGGRWLLN